MDQKDILDYDLEDLLFLELDDLQYETTIQQINLEGWLDFLLNGFRTLTTQEAYQESLIFLSTYSDKLKTLQDIENILEELSKKAKVTKDTILENLRLAISLATKKYIMSYLNALETNLGEDYKTQFDEIYSTLESNDFEKYLEQMESLVKSTNQDQESQE